MISRMTFWSAQAGGDLGRALRADALHLAQPLRLGLDDVEDVLAEHLDHALGIDRPDAADHAGAEVLLDPLDRGGRRGLQEARLELQPVGAVVGPFAGGGDPFAGRDHRGVADRGDQIPVAAGLDAQDAEAVLRVVEGDPLDEPGEDLAIMDGDCALCASGARVIVRLDRKREFRIGRTQSLLGAALVRHYGLQPQDPETWLFIENGQAYTGMEAIIRIGERLGGPGGSSAPCASFPAPFASGSIGRLLKTDTAWAGRISAPCPTRSCRRGFLSEVRKAHAPEKRKGA
jgi:predicted DCC family thiol-disulfide oxidoreductase YuxK